MTEPVDREQLLKNAIVSLSVDLQKAVGFDPTINGQVCKIIVRTLATQVQSLIDENSDVDAES